jgi:hypothetical protein
VSAQERAAEVLTGWAIGSGYYGTQVGADDALAMARHLADAGLLADEAHDRAVAARAWDEGYMRGQYPWTNGGWHPPLRDPIPYGHGPALSGWNANPYRADRVEAGDA